MHEKQTPAHIFRAYDIRGIFNSDLYPDDAKNRLGAGVVCEKERQKEGGCW